MPYSQMFIQRMHIFYRHISREESCQCHRPKKVHFTHAPRTPDLACLRLHYNVLANDFVDAQQTDEQETLKVCPVRAVAAPRSIGSLTNAQTTDTKLLYVQRRRGW